MIKHYSNLFFEPIVVDGRARIKKTAEYRQKVDNLKKEINLTYKVALKAENNIVIKLILLAKKRLKISREVKRLTSLENMYLVIK